MILAIVLLTAFLFSGVQKNEPVSSALTPLGGSPEELLGKEAVTRLVSFGQQRDFVNTRVVDVAGMPFRKALEIEVTATAKYYNSVSLAVRTEAALKKDDVVFLSLYTKCLETSNDIKKGIIEASLGSYDTGYTLRSQFSAGRRWERKYARGRAVNPGSERAVLQLIVGFRPQRILVGGIQLLNYGHRVEMADLPVMPVTYEGIEKDATWRKAAEERIEKHRKSELVVSVTHSGAPAKGVKVSIRLKQHAFGFAGHYSARLHADPAFKGELPIFQRHFREFFNKAVIPNALKWKQYDAEKKRWAEEAYKWLAANSIPARGHCLIWPGWNFLPASLRQYERDPARLRRLTLERIDQVMGDWKGRLVEWDVINECWRQDDLMEICGWEIVTDWFQQARRADPSVKLYYNDANTLANNQPGHQDHYFETVNWLLEQGAPVDGMGFQCHIHQLVPPAVIYERIERFAALGPEIQITEFDVQAPNISQEVMAQFTRDFMTIVFSHPKTVGIVCWMAGNPLRAVRKDPEQAQAAFYYSDWTLKPNGLAWLEMKNRIWTTQVEGMTDNSGKFSTRGFHGEYDIVVQKDGIEKNLQTTIGKDGKVLEVEL